LSCASSRPLPALSLSLRSRWRLSRAAERWRSHWRIERSVWIIVGCAIAVLGIGAVVRDPNAMLPLFGYGSIAIMLVGVYSLAKAARWGSTLLSPANWLICGATTALLGLYCLHYIVASQDIMFWDFMHYREMSMLVASILDQDKGIALLKLFVNSLKDEYSLLPALTPGLVLAATSPMSRAWYEASLVLFYAAPAYIALGVLTRDIAERFGPRHSAGGNRSAMLAVAITATFAAYPTGVAIAARGMPDVGGLILVVAAIRFTDRLARLLALPPGHDARIGRLVRRVALALSLCLFGMFLFRRWYAFAAVGILAMLAVESLFLVATRGAQFRWRQAIGAAAFVGLVLLALGAPVLIDWAPNPARHDYVAIYAAYKKTLDGILSDVFDWYGASLLVAAIGCAIFLCARSRDGRLLRLTCGSCVIAALLFLRVQSPATHHAYLLTPAFAAPIAAVILLAFERWKARGLLALAGLGAVTLTPAMSSWAVPGLAPIAGQPPAPRADLDELRRLRTWYEVNARPDHRLCVLASSYTINDGLVRDLWQLHPKGWPFIADPQSKPDVAMMHVDARDGAPGDAIKGCSIVLVGDPIQTHLIPAYQQTAILPAMEMLTMAGIGANYRRTGEAFNLEKGVKLIAFERLRPLDDADVAALDARWRVATEQSVMALRGAIEK
jgi:hypothetical protein